MPLRDKLRKIAKWIMLSRDPLFSMPIDEQMAFLNKLPEPETLLQRSWLQYRCQMKLNGMLIKILLTLSSLPLMLMMFVRGRNSQSISRRDSSAFARGKRVAIFLREGKDVNVLPCSLENEYFIQDDSIIEGEYLSNEDKRYIAAILKRHPLSWHFVFKLQLKVAQYRYYYEVYRPDAIICCSEYSFASSIMTEWCHNNNIEHIDVMHGDKLLYIRDSFFAFDRCYVWFNEYIRLFTSLRADARQFRIEVPPALVVSREHIAPQVDITYYLGGEQGEILQAVKATIALLAERGYSVCVRPHPRYGNVEEARSTFRDIAKVEDPHVVGIEESIGRTRCTVSLMSTALLQAYCSGILACVDDLSDMKRYEALLERGYILSQLTPCRLSGLLNGEYNDAFCDK